MGGTASVYEPDPLPEQRNRRTLYAEKLRGLRDPFLEAFNQPGPDASCELRESSTVAPQALTLLNAEEVQDRALAFAARLLKEQKNDAAVMKELLSLPLDVHPAKRKSSFVSRDGRTRREQKMRRNQSHRPFPKRLNER
jgi:hypothetical protein